MRNSGLNLSLIWLAALAPAQAPAKDAQQAERPRASQTHVVYRPDGMTQARIETGRTFTSPDRHTLAYDLYRPGNAADGPRGAIVFVSGTESVRHWLWFKDHGRIAAAHGYIGIVPDKRFPSTTAVEAARMGQQDTVALLRHLRHQSESLGIDPERICLWMFSGGGLVAATPYPPEAPSLACMVGYYPGFDLDYDLDEDLADREAVLAAHSPAHAMLREGAPKVPVLLVRSGIDNEFTHHAVEHFTRSAFEANQPLTLINYPEGQHGFDGYDDTDASRQLLRDTYRFLDRHIGPR